jgi:thiol-disulfide isomerase/thioredoxin
MKRVEFSLLLLILLSFASPLESQSIAGRSQPADTPEDMQKLLAETAMKYREVKSYRIERQTITKRKSDLSSIWTRSIGNAAGTPGHRYWREDKWDMNWELRQSDGTSEWIWYPWLRQYSERKIDKSADADDPTREKKGWPGWFEWMGNIDKKLAAGRVQPAERIVVNGKRVNCMVIIGPSDKMQSPDPTIKSQTTYWIDRDRKVLVQEQFTMRSTVPEHEFEHVATTTYKVDFEISLPDSLFTFVPPKGAERLAEFDFGNVSLVGRTAPPLKLKTLDGKDFDLASLLGKPVLVDFWATWCLPCRQSMPMVAKLYEELKDKGLVFVSVSRDEDPAYAARFTAKHKYSWTNLADPTWQSDRKWGGAVIPRFVLIAKDGKVVFESEGYDDAQEARIRSAVYKMDPTLVRTAVE